MFIAVIGAGRCSADVAALAEAVGRGLAKRGAVLVCGGLGGVMEAACRGAKSAGGVTVGILPGTSRREANPYVDIPIVTGMGEARNVLVVQSAQAVIAVHGEYGTLSEIAHALKLGIPVIGLHTWQLAKDGWEDQAIVRAQTAEEAVEKALALAVP
ncbi:MAG: TIGR00725 family protein [Candidatus Hadarchaeum sp.]